MSIKRTRKKLFKELITPLMISNGMLPCASTEYDTLWNLHKIYLNGKLEDEPKYIELINALASWWVYENF